jgi:hypothetical protein
MESAMRSTNVHGPAGKESALSNFEDFSVVYGGPLFQLWRRAGLAGNGMQLTHRRIIAAVLLAWVPLLLLSMYEGRAWGNGVALPFLLDIETHAKLLLAIPLLIAAEVTAHQRLPKVVRQFLDHGLLPAAERPRFDAAIASAMRLRNSVAAELLLITFVYVVGILYIWRTHSTLDVSSWYADSSGGTLHLSRSGWWAAFVSLPLAQFLLVRWYFRLFVWGRFLWQVSRLKLNLVPTHPDGVAGLHFLAMSRRAYTQLLLAQGTVLSGMIANRIFYSGATLVSFKVELVGVVAVMLLVVLGPLLTFTPQLRRVRRRGLDECGILGHRYASEFERKWFHGGAPADEPLIGSADIQSLADFRNSFLVVKDMELVPFTAKNALSMALTTLLPVAPLLLTTFSVEQLVERLLKVIL